MQTTPMGLTFVFQREYGYTQSKMQMYTHTDKHIYGHTTTHTYEHVKDSTVSKQPQSIYKSFVKQLPILIF